VICYRGRDQAKAFNEHHDVAVMRAAPRVGQRSIKLAHDALDDRPHFERLGSRLRGRADQVRHPLLDARIARHAPLVVRAKHSVGQRVDATDGVAQVFELVLERPLRAPLCLRAAGAGYRPELGLVWPEPDFSPAANRCGPLREKVI
jgi:hypothetical protein